MKKIVFVIIAIVIVMWGFAYFCPVEVSVNDGISIPVQNIFVATDLVFRIQNKGKEHKSHIKYKFSPKAYPLDRVECEYQLVEAILGEPEPEAY